MECTAYSTGGESVAILFKLFPGKSSTDKVPDQAGTEDHKGADVRP